MTTDTSEAKQEDERRVVDRVQPVVMPDNSKRNERRCRKKHLDPLTEMTVGEIRCHIDTRNLTQLRLLLRAMNSCTKTNCYWVSYDIAGRFYGDVQEAINIKVSNSKAA